jgi:hypothetical protein
MKNRKVPTMPRSNEPAVVYQISGRELAQMRALEAEIAQKTASFYSLAKFIAQREGLDLAKVMFQQERMAFVPAPQAPAKPA